MNRTTMLVISGLAVVVLAVGGAVVFGRKKTAAPTTSTPATSSSSNMEEMQQGSSAPSPGASSTNPAVNTVTIKDFAFNPATLTVKKGTTVTWTNQDSVAHTVTSDDGKELQSDLLSKGQSFSHTFNTVGTFSYFCKPHPNMKASVQVTE